MKKFFISLMLGFGAALGVFVALAMPPGGWGVAVGVGLGLLGCLPMLIIMMMLVGRGHTGQGKQVYEEAPQPVIIVQHSGGYDPFGGYGGQPLPQYLPQQPAYGPELEYYPYAEPVQRRRGGQPYLHTQAQLPDYHRLPSSHRRSQPYVQYPEYAPEEYYSNYPEEYYEPEAAYYDAPSSQAAQYDAYYGSQEAGYYREQPERPRRHPARVPSRLDAVEADYRTIGEGD